MDDDRLALGEDPAGLALVAHRHRLAAECDRERGDAVGGVERAGLDGSLDAQAAPFLAPVTHADLVDVAVVVDRRPEELGDDDTAGDDHGDEHGDRRPVASLVGALTRRRARRQLEVDDGSFTSRASPGPAAGRSPGGRAG